MIKYKEGDYVETSVAFNGKIRYYNLISSDFGFPYYPGEGPFHRENGPAVEYLYGYVDKSGNSVGIWYIKGNEIPVNNQKEFERYLKLMIFI